jgi:hypothetical protein
VRGDSDVVSGLATAPQRTVERHDPEWREMGFTKALPILTDLLGQEGFIKEIKRVSRCLICDTTRTLVRLPNL